MTSPDRAAALAALAVSTGAGTIPPAPAPSSTPPPAPSPADGGVYAGGEVAVVMTRSDVPLVYVVDGVQRYADPVAKGETAHVTRKQADRLLGLGWAVTPGENVEEALEELEDGKLTDDQLGKLKAADLVAYVVQHPEERERVRALEEERKDPRKTVLTATEPTPEADLAAAERALDEASRAGSEDDDDPADADADE